MITLRSILLLLALIFIACEDTKKQTQEKTTKTDMVDSVTTSETSKKKVGGKLQEKPKNPKLTNENVVDFLTLYGKENPETKVRIKTTEGDIDIELFKDTPLHRANFIYLVKQDYFSGTFFHRVVPTFIIQGGNSDNITTARKRTAIGKDYLLPAEIIPHYVHKYGTISGAKEYRENPDKRTAPFEFFIFLGPPSAKAHLDGNYTVFGRVTKGMDVVEKIANLPADTGEWPLQNVYIETELLE